MDEISSSEFRKRYASLTEPVVVTAGGRPIGQWIPASHRLTVIVGPDGGVQIDPPPMKDQPVSILTTPYPFEPGSVRVKVDRFNSQPFTGPIPKKGK